MLPVRHVVVLRDKSPDATVPSWVQDYALFLLDAEGQVVAWYAGAKRIYGYHDIEMLGQSVSVLDDGDDLSPRQKDQWKRAAGEGHAGTEGWHVRKDGSRFWANTIALALKDESYKASRSWSATSAIGMSGTKSCGDRGDRFR